MHWIRGEHTSPVVPARALSGWEAEALSVVSVPPVREDKRGNR